LLRGHEARLQLGFGLMRETVAHAKRKFAQRQKFVHRCNSMVKSVADWKLAAPLSFAGGSVLSANYAALLQIPTMKVEIPKPELAKG
jgi:hypothetical protein